MKKTFPFTGRRILLPVVASSLVIAGLCYFLPASASGINDRCGVSDAQCVAYLESLGYTNVTVVSYQGCNSICDTSHPYNTKVLVESGIISGYQDLPQK